MDSRFLFACFLSFSSCFFPGFSRNLGEQLENVSTLGNLGAMGNITQGLDGLLAGNGTAGGAGGGPDSLSCVQKLFPCKPYLKSPSPPPDSCCTPLKEMVSEGSQCVCSVFDNPEVLKSLNISTDEALKLPTACGADIDISKCKASSPTSPSTKPSSSPPSPSGSSDNNTPPKTESAANGITQSSVFGFIALFVVFAFSSF